MYFLFIWILLKKKKEVNPQTCYACTSPVWYVRLWDSYEKSNKKQVPQPWKQERARPNWFQYHARDTPSCNSNLNAASAATIPLFVASILPHICHMLGTAAPTGKEWFPCNPAHGSSFSFHTHAGVFTRRIKALFQPRWTTCHIAF